MSQLFYWLTIVGVIVVQGALCYEAITCRGYPPITEAAIWKFNLSPLLVFIPALFADRLTRIRGLLVVSLAVAFLFVTCLYGQGYSIPSPGHLFGFWGVIQRNILGLIVFAMPLTPVVFVLLYLPERVLGDLWRMLWLLPVPNNPSDQDLYSALGLGQIESRSNPRVVQDY